MAKKNNMIPALLIIAVALILFFKPFGFQSVEGEPELEEIIEEETTTTTLEDIPEETTTTTMQEITTTTTQQEFTYLITTTTTTQLTLPVYIPPKECNFFQSPNGAGGCKYNWLTIILIALVSLLILMQTNIIKFKLPEVKF